MLTPLSILSLDQGPKWQAPRDEMPADPARQPVRRPFWLPLYRLAVRLAVRRSAT